MYRFRLAVHCVSLPFMEHKHTNRLIDETSPYLLQHAHNPVDWYPWGEEAFQKAKSENRPILLSIGYSACHWCHVMERESFEDDTIAALMNDLFVNIKVDREERPDLDEIYMNAVQMLTGRGGWPMTVFLTPEGKPFYGGTYFPPEDRYGVPGFPKILQGVANAYREKPQDVERSVEQILAALQRMSLSTESQQPFSPDIIGQSAEQLAQAYDADHGGLGKAPKFPNVGVYELFLRHYHHSKGKPISGDGDPHPNKDGPGGDLRSPRRWISPLFSGREVARTPFRENALRQRPARPHLRAGLLRHGRASFQASGG